MAQKFSHHHQNKKKVLNSRLVESCFLF